MNITFNMPFRNGVYDIDRATEALARARSQVSSLKRVQRPSDDPSASSQIVAEQTEQRQVAAFGAAAASADSRLRVADSVISDSLTLLTTAQTKAAAGANSFVTPSQREAIALEIQGIRDTLLGNVNTQMRGTYLFGGTNSATLPFVKGAGGAVQPYAGNASEQKLDIDRNRQIAVTFDGGAVTGTMFADFDALATAIRAQDTTGIQNGMQKLQEAFVRFTNLQGRVGNDMKDIEGQQVRLDSMRRASVARQSGLQDANLAEAFTNLTQAETAHNAALKAVAGTSRQSLLDYLS